MSQIPTLRVHIWIDQVLADLPPSNGNFTDSYSESSGRPGLGRSSISPSNSDFTDSYSENSYLAGQVWTYLPRSPTVISQILTLRAHIWQTRSWHIFHPLTKQLQFHRFRLRELIFGRLGLGRSTSPLEYNFTDSYSENSYLEDQVLERSTPLSVSNGNFTDSYSENSYLADQVLADLPSPHSVNSDFTDSYSESSYLADQVLGDLSSQMAMSQIPTLRAHIW